MEGRLAGLKSSPKLGQLVELLPPEGFSLGGALDWEWAGQACQHVACTDGALGRARR